MKVLLVNSEKCTGCKLCMLACSLKHEKSFNPLNSRIRVVEDEVLGVYAPYVCEQCGEHACVDACAVNAINYDPKMAIFRVNEDNCVACGNCVKACPYGGIFLGYDGKALKCDLCEGSPECINYCTANALQFIEVTRDVMKMKIKDMLKKLESDTVWF
jgi:Fe-S-cluster-containing hydrogenase component 2